MKGICVLGGVFAPPTRAHLALIEAAIDMTGAETGVLVPSSVAYMRAWRADNLPPPAFLDAEHRLGMLRAFIRDRANLRICEREMHMRDGAYTVDTLRELSREYDTRDVCFIIGADNLIKLDKWHNAGELLTDYRALVCARGDMDVDAILRENPFLLRHTRNILRLTIPARYLSMSASGVRAALMRGDWALARESLTADVFAYIRGHMSIA